MSFKPKCLILSGDGINCETETAFAFEQVGGESHIVHISQLLNKSRNLDDYQILAFPGGFSFGDELGSGQIMAVKIKHFLRDEFERFVADGKPVIGICNGFQILVKLGLISQKMMNQTLALAPNNGGRFLNKWVGMEINLKNHSLWLRGLREVDWTWLPVRHGEGRIVFKDDSVKKHFIENELIAFKYLEDINGSDEQIAGLTNDKGNVLGLMPHPEACISRLQFPYKTNENAGKIFGRELLRNAIDYCK